MLAVLQYISLCHVTLSATVFNKLCCSCHTLLGHAATITIFMTVTTSTIAMIIFRMSPCSRCASRPYDYYIPGPILMIKGPRFKA